MINDLGEAARILCEACPGFVPQVEQESFSDVMEALRRHILDRIRTGQDEAELERIFAALEHVLSEGNGRIRSAIGVALIEHTRREKYPLVRNATPSTPSTDGWVRPVVTNGI